MLLLVLLYDLAGMQTVSGRRFRPRRGLVSVSVTLSSALQQPAAESGGDADVDVLGPASVAASLPSDRR